MVETKQKIPKFKYNVNKVDEGLSVKLILKRRLGFSSRLIKKLKVSHGVLRNGQSVHLFIEVKEGDVISVNLPEEMSDFVPQDISFGLVYEDDDLLIVDKHAGYVVHPTKGHPTRTLANGIMKYMLDTGKNFKIRFVNRIDMDTTGLVIVAKNSHSQDELTKQMREGAIEKLYVAVVEGSIDSEAGMIDAPIGRREEDSVKRIVKQDGYPSVTHYKVLERFKKGYTLIEIKLDTGRTHQIRVHMSYIGHPLVGDALYGGLKPWLIERQALHAWKLSFLHPVTGEAISVEAPVPQDFNELYKKFSI